MRCSDTTWACTHLALDWKISLSHVMTITIMSHQTQNPTSLMVKYCNTVEVFYCSSFPVSLNIGICWIWVKIIPAFMDWSVTSMPLLVCLVGVVFFWVNRVGVVPFDKFGKKIYCPKFPTCAPLFDCFLLRAEFFLWMKSWIWLFSEIFSSKSSSNLCSS